MSGSRAVSLLTHVAELRRRLIIGFVALILAVVAAFPFADRIFDFLVAPLNALWSGQTGRRIIYTALHEKFFVDVKIAFFTGFCVAFPILIAQAWLFIAPGLYRREKYAFLPFMFAAPVLFVSGAAFVYYLLLPRAWAFFAGFEQIAQIGTLDVRLEPKAGEYLSLIIQLILAFGLSFELPVVLILLVRAGIVGVDALRKKRRYAIVLVFVSAAILTPPDPLSQIALAVPLIFLYELSIWGAVLMLRYTAPHPGDLPR